MKKVRIGVLGGYRGGAMIEYCKNSNNAELVAICDKNEEVIKRQKAKKGGENLTYYKDFDEFLKHDMDAVVLANFATEHAPFAVKALRAGKHVFSEVLPCQTLKEAVELVEAVEETGLIYCYGENYCYMAAPREMRKLYKEGKIGEFEYGEGEYVHNCESIWPSITYGNKDHWRNNMYANFYCTHSIGPIIHVTGLRPVSVTGFESKLTERKLRVGSKSGLFGMEIITLENGGIIKSLHGDLYKDSVWYSIYGSKGRMESAREDADRDFVNTIYVNADEFSGEYVGRKAIEYKPEMDEDAKKSGHAGSDYYPMYNFVEKILGNPEADTISVYEALDMFLPGLFAYRSVLAGGVPMQIPNLRNKDERDKYRSDVACTDAKVAGNQVIPVFSQGNPDISDAVYEKVAKDYENLVLNGKIPY